VNKPWTVDDLKAYVEGEIEAALGSHKEFTSRNKFAEREFCEGQINSYKDIRGKLHLIVDCWQPIETAPKNETVLLYRPGCRVDVGRFEPERHHKRPNPYWASIFSFGVTWAKNHPPTHWRPFPASPQSEGDKQ